MKYAKDIEYKIMNGFVIFSVSIFLYFRFHIFDQGACSNIVAPSINRDPSKTPTFVHFKDNSFHSLLVPPVTQNSVQTSKHCLLQCLKNDGCFPLMLVRIHDLMEISRVRFSIQTSTVYLRSFTQTRLSTTTASW